MYGCDLWRQMTHLHFNQPNFCAPWSATAYGRVGGRRVGSGRLAHGFAGWTYIGHVVRLRERVLAIQTMQICAGTGAVEFGRGCLQASKPRLSL